MKNKLFYTFILILLINYKQNAVELFDTGEEVLSTKREAIYTIKRSKFIEPANLFTAFYGNVGLFNLLTGYTAKPGKMISNFSFIYTYLSKEKGKRYLHGGNGMLINIIPAFTYIGEWCEFSVAVPVNIWDLNAPYNYTLQNPQGTYIGDTFLSLKLTNIKLKSKSVQFAYGGILKVGTADRSTPIDWGGSGVSEMKIYFAITRKETSDLNLTFNFGLIRSEALGDIVYDIGAGFDWVYNDKLTLIMELLYKTGPSNVGTNLDITMGGRLKLSPFFFIQVGVDIAVLNKMLFGYDTKLFSSIGWKF